MGLRPTKMDENALELGRGIPWGELRERRGRRRSGEVETDSLSDPERASELIIERGRLPARERLQHVTLCVEV